MSDFTIVRTLEFNHEITNEEILNKIEEYLKEEFESVKIKKKEGEMLQMSCSVKTKGMDNMVCLSGPIDIQSNNNKSKIMIDADAKKDIWSLAVDIVFMVLVPPLIIVIIPFMFWSWFNQKKKAQESLDNVFKKLSFKECL